jgi:flagellar biosynthetic protein FliR
MFEVLLGFVMVLTRISAFFVVAPILSWLGAPLPIKVAATFLLAVFFSIVTPFTVNTTQIALPQAILLLANEAIYGFALGLVVTLVFSIVKFSSAIVEQQMGLSMAQIIDPLTEEPVEPLGCLLEMIFIILFLSANGHHLLLLIVSKSYQAFPAGSIPTISALTAGIIEAGSTMFTASLRLAAPMLAASILLMVALALLARLVPEMNIFFISLPLSIGLGLIMAVVFLPFISEFVAEFADWMAQLVPI